MSHVRTFRSTVRVIVVKDAKICVGSLGRKRKGKRLHVLPGGGQEPNQTLEQAAEVECLQELGIKIKNIESLNFSVEIEHEHHCSVRRELYKGTQIHYYIAEYDCDDDSLYNVEGDAMEYTWMYPYDAYLAILTKKSTDFLDSHRKALELANKYITKRVYSS